MGPGQGPYGDGPGPLWALRALMGPGQDPYGALMGPGQGPYYEPVIF